MYISPVLGGSGASQTVMSDAGKMSGALWVGNCKHSIGILFRSAAIEQGMLYIYLPPPTGRIEGSDKQNYN